MVFVMKNVNLFLFFLLFSSPPCLSMEFGCDGFDNKSPAPSAMVDDIEDKDKSVKPFAEDDPNLWKKRFYTQLK